MNPKRALKMNYTAALCVIVILRALFNEAWLKSTHLRGEFTKGSTFENDRMKEKQ